MSYSQVSISDTKWLSWHGRLVLKATCSLFNYKSMIKIIDIIMHELWTILENLRNCDLKTFESPMSAQVTARTTVFKDCIQIPLRKFSDKNLNCEIWSVCFLPHLVFTMVHWHVCVNVFICSIRFLLIFMFANKLMHFMSS